ncbi:MAG: hypothetical protein AAB362_02735 [Patescibacteria group bacterium]
MKRVEVVFMVGLLMASMSGCIIATQYMYEAPNGDVCLSEPKNGTYLAPPITRLTNGTMMPGLMSTDEGPVRFYSLNCKRVIRFIEPGGRVSIGNAVPATASFTIGDMASNPPARLSHFRGSGFQQAVLPYASGSGPYGLVAEHIFLESDFSIYGDRWKEAKSAYLKKQNAVAEKPLERRFDASVGVEEAIMKQLKEILERLSRLEKQKSEHQKEGFSL